MLFLLLTSQFFLLQSLTAIPKNKEDSINGRTTSHTNGILFNRATKHKLNTTIRNVKYRHSKLSYHPFKYKAPVLVITQINRMIDDGMAKIHKQYSDSFGQIDSQVTLLIIHHYVV